MWTIIVGDGLTQHFLSSDIGFAEQPLNVGRREVERLLGKGKSIGKGPLPSFLKATLKARSNGCQIGLVFFDRKVPSTDQNDPQSTESESQSFVPCLSDIASDAEIVRASLLGIPWERFGEAVSSITGFDPLKNRDKNHEIRFLVIGCHTEHRILGIATFLRNVLGFEKVGICSHLTGSATPEAYYSALRHNCPSADIEVFVDLTSCANFVGFDGADLEYLEAVACELGPLEVRDSLTDHQRNIVQLLCMHWSRAQLRPLQGGFSGSALLLAQGWKGQAQTEPMVLKIDRFAQMRREIDGYHQVKDVLGKHVPTFDYPVHLAEFVGVAMEFAAMEGSPTTLQDTFEEAVDHESYRVFVRRLDKSLKLLVERLYRNTKVQSWVTPYRAMGLHADEQLEFLDMNLNCILEYADQSAVKVEGISKGKRLGKILKLISANEDALESEVCLSHGDLNFQNIICDGADNIWFIDWTHSGYYPIELDFAKLESDVKFAMSKEFEGEDLLRLKKLEEHLIANRMPPPPDESPDSLRFVRWDLRFRKIVDSVRRIRSACFSVKETEDWLIYRISLLRYALHTMSFDKKRDRGECEFPQLMHALYSTEGLLFNLVGDDFHLRIRGERPDSYPKRQRISIDESLWALECPEYDPPYHVDQLVLANDSSKIPGGWADPEDIRLFEDECSSSLARDEYGRPLNPRGRTGIAGRGLLGRWGGNRSAVALITRVSHSGQGNDILLGSESSNIGLRLTKAFVLPAEDVGQALQRALQTDTGWQTDFSNSQVIHNGYSYDPRQTDHAWIDSSVHLLHFDFEDAEMSFQPGNQFEDIRWYPLNAATINRMQSAATSFASKALQRLEDSGKRQRDDATQPAGN